ncbi:hypothetical protein NSQ59_02465 [Margalitia sp. FSL K6-0131]|uniref:hypothetical protein n=1 Tax=Margalitia sp. FSL K6-0131 TaxID=2954604 RepID=UPI0030FC0C96
MRKILTVFLACVLLFTVGFSVNANASTYSDQQIDFKSMSEQIGISAEQLEQTYNDYLAIKDYISIGQDGYYSFDAEGALKNGVNEELVTSTKNDFNNINKGMKEAYNSGNYNILASCKGKSKYEDTIDGGRVYINSCNTDKIVIALAAGAAASTIAGIISGAVGIVPGAVVNGIAAALYGFGATYVAAVDNGCGVIATWHKWILPVSLKAQDCP